MYPKIIEEAIIKEKICSVCGEIKDISEFHKRKHSKDGLRSACKVCRNKQYRQNAQTIIAKAKERYKTLNYQTIEEGVKICSKCKITKEISEFYKNKHYKDGLSCWCKECDKIFKMQYNKNNSEKVKQRNNKNNKKSYDANKKKQYRQRKVKYKPYLERLKIYENIKISEHELLLVQCKYCNNWFNPTNQEVQHRLSACENFNVNGENNFYCNNDCKDACSSFAQKLYPKNFKTATSREVLSELRKMVFERDNWTCIKCGNTNKNSQLHCHHIEGAVQSPMTANDTDNCITVCKECHKEIHKKEGCSYVDYKRYKCE